MTLRELIAERIHAGGPISFAEFMELALYHPELGYYARAAQRTGRAGDFFTSVDVGPMFGELLAKQFSEMSQLLRSAAGSVDAAPRPFDLVEAGSGNGRLSRDVLDAVQRSDPDFYSTIRLSLVEQSSAARDAQLAAIGPHAPLLRYASASLPDHIHGVLFCNELLDALPTHAVVMSEHGLQEVFVDQVDGQFVECLRDPSTPRILEYLSRAGAVMARGWRAEVNLAAEDWIASAAASLDAGFLLIVDYGHDDRELYGSAHAAGTLTTMKQHTIGAEKSGSSPLAACLDEPGERDITAHVDLTAITAAAERSGLSLLGKLDQTYFVLALAMDELQGDQAMDASMAAAAVHRRRALKTLMLPGGLGSTHKVLLFGKNIGTPSLLGLSYRSRVT